jgi:DNA polymerase III gamma/tau subunit
MPPAWCRRWPRATAGRAGAVDGLRGLGLSAAGTLEEMATLLQQMAVEQAVPGALDPTPTPKTRRAPGATLAADETQLLYSMVLHGRGELGLMSDEYAALTMVLLRFLAFPPTMMKGQLAGLMKQAQAMQDNLKKAQDELATIEVRASPAPAW